MILNQMIFLQNQKNDQDQDHNNGNHEMLTKITKGEKTSSLNIKRNLIIKKFKAIEVIF